MTVSEEELRRQLGQAHAMPTGPARFAAIDAVLRHADAAGYTEFAFRTRMQAMSGFHHGGDPTRTFLAFSRCLAVYDTQPEIAQSWDEHSLLWNFKWVVWALPQFPEIPLERTEAVLDDMQRRYLQGGYSLHAVYQHRWLVAHHVGDMAAAQEWYDLMVAAKRDSMSDCAACVPSGQVRHLASLGRFAEAVEVGQPYTRGGCTEQPQWMLSELLVPFLKVGRFDDAVDAHRRGYQHMRGDPHHLDNIAQHVLFCGLTGNEVRGLELVERHLGWLERPSSPFAAMEFASAAALVLTRLSAAGQDGLVVQRRSADGSQRWQSTVGRVRDEMVTHARELAGRFDARNGNTHQSQRAEARMSAEPLVDLLPLTVLAGRNGSAGPKRTPTDDALAALVERVAELTGAGDDSGAALARLDVAHALHHAGRWDDAAEAAEEAVRALDRAGLATDAVRCRYLLWQLYRKVYHHRADALAVMDDILAVDDLPDGLPGRAALLADSAELLTGSEAVQRLLAAADLHAARCARQAELRALRRALTVLQHDAPGDDTSAVLDRATRLVEDDPEAAGKEGAKVDLIAAELFAKAGDLDAALARLDRAIGWFATRSGGAVDREPQARRAELLLRADRPAQAEAQAREVLAADRKTYGWRTSQALVRALRAQGRADEAAQVMAEYDIDEDDLEYDEYE